MKLKKDIDTLKSLMLVIAVFTAVVFTTMILTLSEIDDIKTQNSGKQEIEISTYNGTECMLWYRGQAEIIEVTNNQIVYIDENGLERNLFTGNGIVTITKYK